MKKLTWTLVLVWVLMAVVPAFAGSAEDAASAYGPVLELYAEGLSGNEDIILSDSEEFNYSAWQDSMDAGVAPAEAIGYVLYDLNGDGSPELIIADMTPEQLLEGLVFDIWAIRDGEAKLIRRGWERWRLYLTGPDEDGHWGFYQEGSSGFDNSVFEQGRFLNGEAVTEHSLVYEAGDDVPWQLDAAGIDEETAYATIDAWNALVVPVEGLMPFTE